VSVYPPPFVTDRTGCETSGHRFFRKNATLDLSGDTELLDQFEPKACDLGRITAN
jgi:hypothetical protein